VTGRRAAIIAQFPKEDDREEIRQALQLGGAAGDALLAATSLSGEARQMRALVQGFLGKARAA